MAKLGNRWRRCCDRATPAPSQPATTSKPSSGPLLVLGRHDLTDTVHQAMLKVPASTWTPAVVPDDEIRDGACVCELDGDVLNGWPTGMQLIVRKERPHPGASRSPS